ncbi:adenylate/guanylate cyclase domain-containing protein [Rhodoferax sp.]|uniref:adenylate/guanylate cyclase domain-containing protein n=1 Tax=Rhodoferax sp. TaxID=50421 RepID=UPI0028514CBA|nr:adenylate/guanylate cyclase domain-containing protein [Rhodoferax sp.]MDR3371784.1 adenylate/guanylate cyclase domain-containing protein [Rhodoferax sp.]
MSVQSTVVFADLFGSTGVFESLGNAKATELVTQATAWVAQRCSAHGGRVVKFLGDGVLIIFEDSTKAVLAVMDLQHSYQQVLGCMPPKAYMPLRVGVARGGVELVADDCYGDAVNIAARLSELTGPHQIWVNSEAIEDGFDVPDPRFRLLGPIHIRGRAESCKVYQVEWQEDQNSEQLTVPAGFDLSSRFGSKDALGVQIELAWLDQKKSFNAFDLPIHIGRTHQVEFVVSDARVSRTHARLDWRNGSVVLVDLSSYGCWVRFAGGGADLLLRREECVLHGRGEIALGTSFSDPSAPVIEFLVL